MKRMGKRGFRSKKGKGESKWGDEPKNVNITVAMTPTGRDALKKRVKTLNTSISEVLEHWGRGYEVDDESSVASPPIPIDFETVWRSLSEFSPEQIIQIGIRCFQLLMPNFSHDTDENLPNDSLFAGKDLDAFAQEARIPYERLVEIANGSMPDPGEITKLARAFRLRPVQMKAHFDERKQKQGNGCSNGT
jgi:hypothetical protein